MKTTLKILLMFILLFILGGIFATMDVPEENIAGEGYKPIITTNNVQYFDCQDNEVPPTIYKQGTITYQYTSGGAFLSAKKSDSCFNHYQVKDVICVKDKPSFITLSCPKSEECIGGVCVELAKPDYTPTINGPTSAQVGQTAWFNVTTTNIDANATDYSHTKVWYAGTIGGPTWWYVNTTPLATGQTQVHTFGLGCINVQTVTIEATNDFYDDLDESNENNNIDTFTFDCISADKPDYTPTINGPASAPINQTVWFNITTTNIGTGDAVDYSTTKFWYQGTIGGPTWWYAPNVTPLTAGGTSYNSFGLHCTNQQVVSIEITNDLYDEMDESNESNNIATHTLYCG